MVHDSYGCHAKHAPVMARVLRHVVADVFSQDLLETFKSEVESYLPCDVRLPDIPPHGSLDPEVVRDSDYFFA